MSLLRKLFLILFAVIIIPTMILMSVNYWQTKSFIEDEAILNNHQIVKQAKVASDSIISQTERISSQIAIDSSTQQFMFGQLDAMDYDEYQVLDDVYTMMLNFKAGTQYIEEIGVYNLDTDLLISTDKTEQPAVSIKTEEYLTKMADESPMKLWIEPNSSGVFWEQLSEFHFIRFIYTNMDELAGFVVIKVKNNDFDRLINEMFIKDDGMIFIADQTGKLILSSTSEYRNIIDLTLNFDWINQDENYGEVTLSGQRYFLSLVTSDYNNWKYISIIDKNEIETKLKMIRNNTLILVGFFLLVSLGLSFAISKGIYNPIEWIRMSLEGGEKKKVRNNFLLGQNEFLTINNDITTLMDELRARKLMQDDYDANVKKLHKYQFYRLIKGEQVDEEEMVPAMKANEDGKNEYRLMIMEFFRKPLSSFEERIRTVLKDAGLVEYFFESDTRAVVLMRDDGSETEMPAFDRSLREVLFLEAENQSTVTVIGQRVDFEDIKAGYEHLLKIVKYCLLKNMKGIIYESELSIDSEHKRLPYDYQTYLNNSLRSTSIEECRTIILELEKVVKSDFYYVSNYSFYYKDVLNTIIGFLYEIQYIKSEDMQEVTESFSDFDRRFKTVDEATQWTLKFVDNIFTFMGEATTQDEEDVVNQSVKIIEKEFMNDISLGEVAERLNLSVPYLSKQFKEKTGINFKDYVTGCKIEKAKQLLLSSSDTIENIALQVGYNSSLQLVRMFKKNENVTPTEYRKSH